MASYLDKKLLVVGAGGIGCELLKNLILTGFTQIEIIDLDTIELSNLNRQFLFQKIHVGKPKAVIARESVLKYNPDANLIAHHDSIMNVKYNVEYFKQFALVLNALDNKAARSHVNRLCLAADVPLVESGTAGYLGQITLIKKGLTECYDCLPKPPAKTFPGCTIRNTPSEPIHCIVWAKHLFNQLFGAEDPDEAVSPDGEDPENMADAGQVAASKSTAEEAVNRISTRQWAKQTNYDPLKLFNKLFSDDIKYLLSMSKLWEKRTPPKPLDWHSILNSSNGQHGVNQQSNGSNEETSDKPIAHKIWNLNECCHFFSESVIDLCKRIKELEANDNENPILAWDKDDEDAMNFVTAASNLRCHIFSIPLKSKFETKSLAGNIIPAIATTNAIVAGLIVLQALKVLNEKIDECKAVFVRDKPTLNKLIVSSFLVKPNPKCYVCAPKPEIIVKLNLSQFTIKQFETKILKKELNMVQPDVEIDDGTGRIIISSEEGETEDNNEKALSVFGLTDQSSLKCDDFFQNYELSIRLLNCEKFDDAAKEYEIIVDKDMLKEVQENVQKENSQKAKEEEEMKLKKKRDVLADSNDIINIDENSNGSTTSEEKKRTYEKAFEDDENANSLTSSLKENCTKKRKSSENDTNGFKIYANDELNDKNNGSINNNNSNNEDLSINISNSINDASDALSDEEEDDDEELVVQPKKVHHHHHQHQQQQQTNGNTNYQHQQHVHEIVVDDDIIIEEDSNDLRNEEEQDETRRRNNANVNNNSSNNNNNMNGDSNGQHLNDSSSDIIECTNEEEEEIIEINEEEEDEDEKNCGGEEEDDDDDDEIDEELSCSEDAENSNSNQIQTTTTTTTNHLKRNNVDSNNCEHQQSKKHKENQDDDAITLIE